MTKFMYNGGSYAHRGVWHVVETVFSEYVPARESVKEYPEQNHTNDYSMPDHFIHRADAICGQVKMRQSSVEVTGPRWCWREKPHKEHVVHERTFKDTDLYLVDPPMNPAPLCSRCAKKAGV